MMEFKTLSLDEAAVSSLPEAKRPVYIFEWLRFLEGALELSSRKSEIRENNDAFVNELNSGNLVGLKFPAHGCVSVLRCLGNTSFGCFGTRADEPLLFLCRSSQRRAG